jgi:hypothetical protein
MSSCAGWRDPGLRLRHGKQPLIFMSSQVSLGIVAHNHKRNNSLCAPRTWLIFQKQAQLACQRRQVPLHCMRLQSAVKGTTNCPRKRASSQQGMGTTTKALSVGVALQAVWPHSAVHSGIYKCRKYHCKP